MITLQRLILRLTGIEVLGRLGIKEYDNMSMNNQRFLIQEPAQPSRATLLPCTKRRWCGCRISTIAALAAPVRRASSLEFLTLAVVQCISYGPLPVQTMGSYCEGGSSWCYTGFGRIPNQGTPGSTLDVGIWAGAQSMVRCAEDCLWKDSILNAWEFVRIGGPILGPSFEGS